MKGSKTAGGDLSGFARFLAQVRGRSPSTVQSYLRDLKDFADYAERSGWSLQEALKPPRVGLYLVERTESRQRRAGEPAWLSGRSAARLVSALKAYCDFLVFDEKLTENPLAGLKGPKYSRKLPPYFSSEEMRLLVTAFNGSAKPLDLRNAAVLHMLYAAGLRVSECAALDLSDVRSAGGMLQVTGKGNRQRVVPVGKPALAALKQYLEFSALRKWV